MTPGGGDKCWPFGRLLGQHRGSTGRNFTGLLGSWRWSDVLYHLGTNLYSPVLGTPLRLLPLCSHFLTPFAVHCIIGASKHYPACDRVCPAFRQHLDFCQNPPSCRSPPVPQHPPPFRQGPLMLPIPPRFYFPSPLLSVLTVGLLSIWWDFVLNPTQKNPFFRPNTDIHWLREGGGSRNRGVSEWASKPFLHSVPAAPVLDPVQAFSPKSETASHWVFSLPLRRRELAQINVVGKQK